MFKKCMADLIEELSDMPLETQEAVLNNLSKDMVPVEINDNIYMVHKDVSELIDGLVEHIRDITKRDKLNVREESN